jgi:hypothetical protein
MSCKRHPVEVLQQGPNPKKSRLDQSEPPPPPWWQARGRREPITNPDLCFVCQRNDGSERIPSQPESTTKQLNSILSYFRKSDSAMGRCGHPPIASQENRRLPPSQHCQSSTAALLPCRYCERSICRGCLVQCPNCQHDFCSLCWGPQGDNCVECQWSRQGSPPSMGVVDSMLLD